MRRAIPVLTLALLTTPAAAQPNPAQSAWSGEYRYEWSGGRTVGGSGIAVSYTLRLGAGVTDCALDIEGYQSDDHILCEAGANPGNLWIRFRSYADGRLVNKYGTALYRPGQDLFRLRAAPNGPPLTEWQSLSPDDKKSRPAIRFTKS